MSLIIHLPLNGNTKNLGLDSDYDTPTINYAVWANEGKIGGKSLYPTTTTSGVLNYSKTLSATLSYSICVWFKNTDETTSHRWLIWNGSDQYYGFGIALSKNGRQASFKMFDKAISATINLNEWHHLAITIDYDNLTYYGYLDGNLIGSLSYTVGTIANFGFNVGWLRPSYYPADGYINDVRVYDHCLSPKEVKEISKGLVLHYKLDDILSPNLFHITRGTIETVNGIRWEAISESEWSATGTKTTSYGGPGDLRITKNGIYFIKAWKTGSKSTNANVYARIRYKNGTYSSYYNVVNQSLFLTKDDSVEYISVWPQDDHNTVGTEVDYTVKILICKSNIEQDYIPYSNLNIVYDSSGYNNNGSILGTLSLNNDTPRYNYSTGFDGNTSGILIENLEIGNIINTSLTYSFWIKPDSENGARSVYFGSYSETSFSVEKRTENTLRLYWNNNPDLHTNLSITDGQWQYIAITKNGTSEIKVYLNGELIQTLTNTCNNLTFPTTYRIGRDVRSSDGTPYKGLMSDFRIYATALSAEDIKELYNMSAFITNNGTIEAYEFVENNSNEIEKTGIIKSEEFIEKINYLYLPVGKYVNTGLSYGTTDKCKAVTVIRYDSNGSGRDLMGFSSVGSGYWGVKADGTWEMHYSTYTNSDITEINTINYTYNNRSESGTYVVGALGTKYSTRNKYIYSVKLYKNDVLERDMIPFSMNSLNGLYDLITDTFYPCNSGGELSTEDSEAKIFETHIESNSFNEI